MSVRKDGPVKKPGVLDVWCTVFWADKSKPFVGIAEIYVGRNDSSEQRGGADVVESPVS